MKTTSFSQHLGTYFDEYLPNVRNYSPNTIASYQDTITACNNAGVVLPFTGGTGFTTYILLAALALMAGVYFCKRSNIKKETTE